MGEEKESGDGDGGEEILEEGGMKVSLKELARDMGDGGEEPRYQKSPVLVRT